MHSYLTLTLLTTFISVVSFSQTNVNQQVTFTLYDSSYDFSEIRTRNRNPKDLIGQELEFALPSTNHVIGSNVSLFYNLRDSLFICFSSSITKKLSELTDIFPEESTGFDLVDCTRHPADYSYQFLRDSATTNTYKPKLVFTESYPFALRHNEKGTKMAMVVGTTYSSLAGKTFKIKDASCYFDYYDSQVSYFFDLIDQENNKVTLYFDYNQPLEQMIHIKGFVKKQREVNANKVFQFPNSFQIEELEGGKTYAYDIKYLENPTSVSNEKWTIVNYKYISTPERYFQTLYFELKNQGNKVIYVRLYTL